MVSQALEKYSIDAVLQGLPTAQTMVVGSTHNEEKLDEAYGKGDRQFVGYVSLCDCAFCIPFALCGV